MDSPDKDTILKTMIYVCKISPGKIYVFGGSVVHPAFNLKRARRFSNNVDFYVPGEDTFEKIRSMFELSDMAGIPYSIINGLYAFFFVGEIEGLKLPYVPPQVFQTDQGDIYTLPLPLIAALKFRRGILKATKGH